MFIESSLSRLSNLFQNSHDSFNSKSNDFLWPERKAQSKLWTAKFYSTRFLSIVISSPSIQLISFNWCQWHHVTIRASSYHSSMLARCEICKLISRNHFTLVQFLLNILSCSRLLLSLQSRLLLSRKGKHS